jgi:pyruvate/2-oxoglutarate dehydrogenase complex dihydrolipoamide dehydrogenase (E3) component
VVGGGPIGVELGQAFERLGTQVTIIEGLDRILPKEDPEVSAILTNVLQSEGITIATNATFVKAGRNGNKKVVVAQQGDQFLTFEADEILLTLGRRPNVEGSIWKRLASSIPTRAYKWMRIFRRQRQTFWRLAMSSADTSSRM